MTKMTKIVLSAVVSLTLLVLVSSGPIPEEFKEIQPEIRKTCLAKSGVADDLVNKVSDGYFSDTPEFKCYLKCLFDHFRLMSKKGINFEALLTLSPPSMKEDAAVMISKCRHLKGTDQCDLAFNVAKCFYATKPDTYFVL